MSPGAFAGAYLLLLGVTLTRSAFLRSVLSKAIERGGRARARQCRIQQDAEDRWDDSGVGDVHADGDRGRTAPAAHQAGVSVRVQDAGEL